MLIYPKLFLHRKSDFTFRYNMPEYSAHALFVYEFSAPISYAHV